jgi:coenzyme F420-0:L-glutamate ligase/coenzyme F420-1:gamma-L-glutamate ligase
MRPLAFTAVPGIADVEPGIDLGEEILRAASMAALPLAPGDVVIVAQKIVSKAEGRFVDLRKVVPSERARELARRTAKDARLVEVVLGESTDVVRAARNVLVTRHRLGFVMANAGVDRSNIHSPESTERVLLLPRDPDASARALRARFESRFGEPIGVIVSDSFGRPWRLGVINVAIGVAGLPALIDRRGESDRYGRKLEMTQVALADSVAAAAGTAMGEAAEGTPVVIARGLDWQPCETSAAALVRPVAEDLFR